jgi:hypothetical protein
MIIICSWKRVVCCVAIGIKNMSNGELVVHSLYVYNCRVLSFIFLPSIIPFV